MVHRPGHHEQRTFIKGVSEDHDHGGLDGVFPPHANEHDQHAKNHQRGVRQDLFQVRVTESQPCGYGHRYGTERYDESRPQRRTAEDGQ